MILPFKGNSITKETNINNDEIDYFVKEVKRKSKNSVFIFVLFEHVKSREENQITFTGRPNKNKTTITI